MKKKDDIIVIGAGIGGLSAGAYLARKGYKVTLLERLHQPGGYVHTFKRGDYTFEASTHQMCGLNDDSYLKKTLKLLGIDKELEITESEHSFEAVLFDTNNDSIKKRYLLKAGYKEAYESLTAFFSEDKETIKKIFYKIGRISKDLFRIKNLQREFPLKYPLDLISAMWLKHPDDYSIRKKLGKLAYPYLVKYKDKSYNEIIKNIQNEELKFILSQHSYFVGLNPEKIYGYVIATLVYLYILKKPVSLKGGTSSILKAMIKQIENNGGKILYHSEVKQIIVKNDIACGVKLSDNKEYYAKYIISNSTAHDTFTKLTNNEANINIQPDIKKYKPSRSVFQIYLGLPYKLTDFGFKASTTFFNNNINMDIMMSENLQPSIRTPFMLTNYKLTNPEFYMKDKTGLVIAEYDNIERWNDLDEKTYKKQKKDTRDMILKKVSKITGLPLNKAEICFSGTPKTMTYYSGDLFGSIVGAEVNIEQGAINRWPNKTPVKNLYLVGSDSQPSGGISSCIDSGVITGQSIIRGK